MRQSNIRKLVYIVSSVDEAIRYFQALTPFLRSRNYNVDYIILSKDETYLEKYLKGQGINVIRARFSRKAHLPRAIWAIYKHLITHPHFAVHAHLFEASLAGMLAARLARSPYRICTRWHSDMHRRSHPRAVKYDRLCNALATHIVTPSAGTKEYLVTHEGVSHTKIQTNEIGFDVEQFQDVDPQRIENLKKRYNPQGRGPCIGVIARQVEWKGVHHVVEAFRRLQKAVPNAYLILANAKGDYKHKVDELLKELPEFSYTEILHEPDVHALYHVFDIFVHTPIGRYSEPGGQVYVEGLLSGVPCVFTKSGVVLGFARDKEHCMVVRHKDPEEIYRALHDLIKDPRLARAVAECGQRFAFDNFAAGPKMQELCEFYESLA